MSKFDAYETQFETCKSILDLIKSDKYIKRIYSSISSFIESENKETASQLANRIYSLYINDLKNIATKYGFYYVDGKFIIESQEVYSVNNLKGKPFRLTDLERGLYPIQDYETADNILKKIDQVNGFYQPILAVTLPVSEGSTDLKYHIFDGAHRFLALALDLINTGEVHYPTLMINFDHNKDMVTELNIPKLFYDAVTSINPSITSESPNKKTDLKMEFLYAYNITSSDIKYCKVRVSGTQLIMTICCAVSLITDYIFYSLRMGKVSYKAAGMIHDINYFKGANNG